MAKGWIGCDLDGTLAVHSGHKGMLHVGDPVPKMLARVLRWLDAGIEVRIVTARVSEDPHHVARGVVEKWLMLHVGQLLPITNEKDYDMFELWDDRAVQVVQNTGDRVGKVYRRHSLDTLDD